MLQLGNVPAANKREVCNLGVGSNIKENDERISFLIQMPDSLAKGSLRDAWIAVHFKKNRATSDHQRSSCIISAVNRHEQEQLGESDRVQAMTYEQEGKKVEK